jgi:amino acid permease
MGVTFGYFCWLIAKVCKMTGRHTYRGIWQETMGHTGSVGVSIANALKAALADLAYATILADTLNSLFASAGWQVPRVICLFLITVTAILPLCLLKNLHVLAPFSVVGTAGIIFTAIAMAIRYLDGSYQPGGRFHDNIDPSLQPHFGKTNGAWSTGILPFVCMLYEVSRIESMNLEQMPLFES